MNQSESPTDADLWAAWDLQNGAMVSRETVGALVAAFYGRCSTEDNQDPETSKNWQMRAAGSLLETAAPGTVIVEEFFDIGHSRSLPWKRRPEAQRLLDALEDPNRTWNAIVVGEGQRCWFGSQFAEVAPVLDHYGVALLVPELGGAYNPANSTHFMLMTLSGGMSRGERQRVQERVRLGMASQVAQQGRYQGGRPPYGYRAIPVGPHPNPRKAAEGFQQKALAPDPTAAPVVRRIFAEILEGKSLRAIVRDLNAEGVPCPSAHDRERNSHRAADGWQVSTVSAIADNPRYTGYEFWGRFKKVETLVDPSDPSWGHKTRLARSDQPLVRSNKPAHESLVSVADWHASRAILGGRSAGGIREMGKGGNRNGRRASANYPFKGMVFCTACGRAMWASRYNRANDDDLNPRFVRYRCRRRDLVAGSHFLDTHPAEVRVGQVGLLDGLSNWLADLFSPEHRERTIDLLTAGLAGPTPTDAVVTRQAKQLADARQGRQRLIASIEAGVDPAEVAPRIKELGDQISALELALTQGATHATHAPGRQEVQALVTEVAPYATDVFASGAPSVHLRTLFEEFSLRIDYDHVAGVAHAQMRLDQPKSSYPHPWSPRGGDNVRVRGGT